jgi:hypothetical protein
VIKSGFLQHLILLLCALVSSCVAASIILYPPSLYADDENPGTVNNPSTVKAGSSDTSDESGKKVAPDENVADLSHRMLSENLIDISKAIDGFFAGDRVLEESVGSYGCMSANVFYKEGGDTDTYSDFCLKIDLPSTKKRWKLVITSDEEDEEERSLPQGAATLPAAEPQDTGALAGFRYIAREEILRHINFDIGVKAKTPVDPFARARFRRVWLPKPWLYRLTESIYWFKSTEGGVLSRVDVERAFAHDVYTRLTTEADFRDAENRFHLRQTIGIYRRVGKGKALNLEWQLYATTDNPNTKVQYYAYRARYRFNVWRDWFFVEISPQILYQREHDFHARAGILFSAEAVFGNY